MNPPSGTRRNRKTQARVIVADRLAGILIRGGGFMIIVAVLGIFVFLAYVVVPLFRAAEVGKGHEYALAGGSDGLLFAEVNEYGSLGMALRRDGVLQIFDGSTGKALGKKALVPEGSAIAAWSRSENLAAVGLADGRVVLANLCFTSRYLGDSEVPGSLECLKPGEAMPLGEGVAEKTALGPIRVSEVSVDVQKPVSGSKGGRPIKLLDGHTGGHGVVLAVLDGDGNLTVSEAGDTEEQVRDAQVVKVPFEPRATEPAHLLFSSQGDELYLAWEDGILYRFDLRDASRPALAEKVDLCPNQVSLTQIGFMLGHQSIIACDSAGGVTAWFRLPAAAEDPSQDGYRMVPAHDLERHHGSVTALAMSSRDKTFATGSSTGEIWLRHMTSERVLARLHTDGPAVTHLQIAPKGDILVAVTANGCIMRWPFSNPHPETSLSTVFGKTWYEGYREPEHSWQSGGSNEFEPKLGLVPLIFGTLKATLYAMLFSVPIALLAAVYSSEFLSRKARAAIKPTIELMASLPSVVLGFIAALVLAPLIESRVLSLITLFFVVPLAIVLAAYLWLCVPRKLALKWEGARKNLVMVAVFVAAVCVAFPIGALLEDLFFLGDFRAWLAPPRRGTGTAFWAAALLPFAMFAVIFARRRWLPRLRNRERRPGPLAELLGGIANFGAALVLSALVGGLLTLGGVDPRDSLVGTYVQRNTMIVGFVMGFAVIPIVYTIAEDALSSVPDHLRGAALGCGATPWQTAVRVVVPTAMSGIFSAIMVGLGRAVGETMIVLMAAGNTAIIDANPFNGLRALSATIAVELPEAVKDGTLYRMLFLAALSLFAMTFVVNTVAEIVRLRFRKRAFEL